MTRLIVAYALLRGVVDGTLRGLGLRREVYRATVYGGWEAGQFIDPQWSMTGTPEEIATRLGKYLEAT